MINQELYDKLHKKEFDEAEAESKDDSFFNELEQIEMRNQDKSERVRELEKKLISISDIAFVKNWELINSLNRIYSLLILSEMKWKMTEELNCIYNLAREHREYAKELDFHPNYSKIEVYMGNIINKLHEEISLRKKKNEEN